MPQVVPPLHMQYLPPPLVSTVNHARDTPPFSIEQLQEFPKEIQDLILKFAKTPTRIYKRQIYVSPERVGAAGGSGFRGIWLAVVWEEYLEDPENFMGFGELSDLK